MLVLHEYSRKVTDPLLFCRSPDLVYSEGFAIGGFLLLDLNVCGSCNVSEKDCGLSGSLSTRGLLVVPTGVEPFAIDLNEFEEIDGKNTLPSRRRSFLLSRASVWMTVIQCRWGLYNGDCTG